jgi:predicted GIY-YIG superfamily endonuclease
MVIFIYALIDPRTDEIRYIGKTVNPVSRFQAHKNRRINTHCSAWVASLASYGCAPVLRTLEALPNSDGVEAERWWIAEGKRLGWRLPT